MGVQITDVGCYSPAMSHRAVAQSRAHLLVFPGQVSHDSLGQVVQCHQSFKLAVCPSPERWTACSLEQSKDGESGHPLGESEWRAESLHSSEVRRVGLFQEVAHVQGSLNIVQTAPSHGVFGTNTPLHLAQNFRQRSGRVNPFHQPALLWQSAGNLLAETQKVVVGLRTPRDSDPPACWRCG